MSEVSKADPLGPDVSVPVHSGITRDEPYPGKINHLKPAPASTLTDQIKTYEKVRAEIRDRVRKQALEAKADHDRAYLAIRTDYDRKVSDEVAKLEQARMAAYRDLFDSYERLENEHKSLLLRLDE